MTEEIKNMEEVQYYERKFSCDILCPYCSAPWDHNNLKLYYYASVDYGSCEEPASFTVQIVCHACKKLMYQKGGYAYC